MLIRPDKKGIYLNGKKKKEKNTQLLILHLGLSMLAKTINLGNSHHKLQELTICFSELKDTNGKTALEVAMQKGDRQAAKILVLLFRLAYYSLQF